MFFRYFPYIIVLILTGFIFSTVGCGSDQPATPSLNTDGTWEHKLSGIEVHSLEYRDGIAFAGTDEGVYRMVLQSDSGIWTSIGLKADSTMIIDLAVWSKKEIVAVVKHDNFDPHNPMLYKTSDGGITWEADFSTEIPTEGRFLIKAIEKHPVNQDEVFVYRGFVLHSVDKGESWNNIFDQGSNGEFLSINKFHPDQIWGGGTNDQFGPYIVKSEDRGENWVTLNQNIRFNSDATVYDAIISSVNGDQIMAGMGAGFSSANVIRQSRDGGQSWETVLEDIYTRSLEYSANNPETIYATGGNPEGNIFFAVTADFGNSWERVIHDNGPGGVMIYDLISIKSDGREILFLATTDGIYSYTFTDL